MSRSGHQQIKTEEKEKKLNTGKVVKIFFTNLWKEDRGRSSPVFLEILLISIEQY